MAASSQVVCGTRRRVGALCGRRGRAGRSAGLTGTWRASSLMSSILIARNYQSRYLDVKGNFMNTSHVPRQRKSGQDHVDSFLEEISADLPSDLDLTVEGIVERVQGINR